MEKNEQEFLSARKAERKAEKSAIRQASDKLGEIIRQHAESRRKGGGVSPLVSMAERIQAREEAGNGIREEA